MDGWWWGMRTQPFVTQLASGDPSPLESLLCWSVTGEEGDKTLPQRPRQHYEGLISSSYAIPVTGVSYHMTRGVRNIPPCLVGGSPPYQAYDISDELPQTIPSPHDGRVGHDHHGDSPLESGPPCTVDIA